MIAHAILMRGFFLWLDYLQWDPAFFQIHHLLLSAHAVSLRCCLYRSTMCNFFVSRLAHATALSTIHNSIYQVAWEPCHNYTGSCQRCSTSVGWHHSCHKQVSSILQQCMVDDLVLVVVDTQHHGSHHKIVLEEILFWDQYEKDPILCWLSLLTTHPKSRSCGSRWITLLIFLLFVLESSQYPSGLCLELVIHSTAFSEQLSFPFVFVDPVSVRLLVLVVTLNARSRHFLDPRLLNLHLSPELPRSGSAEPWREVQQVAAAGWHAKMTAEVLAHEI